CVIFNSAAAGPTRRGATAQEEKRSPSRTTPRNPNVRSFIVTIPDVARRKRLKPARRELCRTIRHLGSAMQTGIGIAMQSAKRVVATTTWSRSDSGFLASRRNELYSASAIDRNPLCDHFLSHCLSGVVRNEVGAMI